MGFIYKLTFPSEKSYIGQTIRPIHERLKEHQLPSSNCVAVYNAIQKYGWENVKIDWYECPDEDLNFDEELLVEEMGTLAPGGYNLMEGGGSKGRPSEETKQKMSEALSSEKNPMYGKTGEKHHMFGNTLSDEHKQKISEAQSGEKNPMFGKEHAEISKQKMSEAKSGEKNPMFGKEHTEKTKQKMSEAKSGEKNHMFGKEHTDESKKKISKALSGEKHHASKRVYQYTLDGTYVDSYGSSEEAARALGKTNGSNISMCARGKRKDAYGFKWSRELL